jgi:hypothetical protein
MLQWCYLHEGEHALGAHHLRPQHMPCLGCVSVTTMSSKCDNNVKTCDNREGHPCSITVPGVQFHEEAVRHPLRGRPLEALTPVYQGVRVVSQRCHSIAKSGVRVVLEWCYSGVALVSQWCYSCVGAPWKLSRPSTRVGVCVCVCMCACV